MSRSYRCYFLGLDNKIKDVVEFDSAADDAAVARARQCFERQRIYAGFELWEGSRFVVLWRQTTGRA